MKSVPSVISALLCLAGISAQAVEADLSGYLKSFGSLTLPPAVVGAPATKPYGGWASRLRVQAAAQFSETLSGLAAYDLAPSFLRSGGAFGNEAFTAAATRPYRLADFSPLLYSAGPQGNGSLSVFHNLDRWLLTYSPEFGDITVGRQPIAFGSGRAVNPTDVLTPFAYAAIDQEDVIGVDAVRVRIPLGDLSELDLGAVAGNDLDLSRAAAFIRTRFHVGTWDISPLVLTFQGNHLAGLDLQTSLAGAALWMEAAHVWTDPLSAADDTSYLRLTAGGDYSPREGVYVFAEYHFNGAGLSEPSQYLLALNKTAYREGGTFLAGRHYFIPGATWAASPLLNLSVTVILNLRDVSGLAASRFEYNVAENVYWDGGLFLGWGRPAVQSAGTSPPDPQSEFGSFPPFLYTSLRYYY